VPRNLRRDMLPVRVFRMRCSHDYARND
jgi:hypothetical protein